MNKVNDSTSQLYLCLTVSEIIVETSNLQIESSSFVYLSLLCEEVKLVTNDTIDCNASVSSSSSSKNDNNNNNNVDSNNESNDSLSVIDYPQGTFNCKNCCCILGLPPNFQSSTVNYLKSCDNKKIFHFSCY